MKASAHSQLVSRLESYLIMAQGTPDRTRSRFVQPKGWPTTLLDWAPVQDTQGDHQGANGLPRMLTHMDYDHMPASGESLRRPRDKACLVWLWTSERGQGTTISICASKPYPLAASRPPRRLFLSRPSPSARALLALANCSALADKLYSSISHDTPVNTMILRESESNNMGRGAYDTTGTPKPSPTTTPPTK
ncbi:hypothetical protein BM1_06829 [Bipolaris maydis]|nr:hypothetical protein BM1_06829 [Bipolaris maydis]